MYKVMVWEFHVKHVLRWGKTTKLTKFQLARTSLLLKYGSH